MELMPMQSNCSTPPSYTITTHHRYGYGNVGRTTSTSMMAPLEASTILMKSSSSAAAATSTGAMGASSEERLLERFGSIDSSDTFLSCNTHAFPSQGSLAGLEELAAIGSMAANGSMPAVNIPGFNNQTGMYMHVNPFDPPSSQRRSHNRRISSSTKQYTSKAEELNERRRVRMNLKQRSMSSDNSDFQDDDELDSNRVPSTSKTYTIQNNRSAAQRKQESQSSGTREEKGLLMHSSDTPSNTIAPKHQRTRVSQVSYSSIDT